METNLQLSEKMMIEDVFSFEQNVPTFEMNEDQSGGSFFSPELLLQIFQHSNVQSLCNIAAVSSSWKILSEDWTIWKNLCFKDNILKEQDFGNRCSPPNPFKSWKDAYQWHHQCHYNEFKPNEVKNGLGSFVWQNGAKFEGEWKEDREHGRGKKIWADGASYEGDWIQGKFEGYGIHTWASGSKYEGTWTKHKRNGWGRNTWPQKDVYEGKWQDDQKNGYGVYYWSDGRIYKGMWKNDRRCGAGTFTWAPNGYKYEGEWLNDRGHGVGRFHWENGDYFEGQWVNGRRYGKGKFVKSTGEAFLQDWKEDREFNVFDKGDMTQIAQPVDSSFAEEFGNVKRKLQMESDGPFVCKTEEPNPKKRCLVN